MSEVVQFPVREPEHVVWVCNCGSTTHYHHASGEVECGSCGTYASGLTGEWRQRLPATPADPAELGGANFKVVNLNTAEVFLKRQLKDDSEIVAAVIVRHDGGTSTWGRDIDGDARKGWLLSKLADAYRRMIGP